MELIRGGQHARAFALLAPECQLRWGSAERFAAAHGEGSLQSLESVNVIAVRHLDEWVDPHRGDCHRQVAELDVEYSFDAGHRRVKLVPDRAPGRGGGPLALPLLPGGGGRRLLTECRGLRLAGTGSARIPGGGRSSLGPHGPGAPASLECSDDLRRRAAQPAGTARRHPGRAGRHRAPGALPPGAARRWHGCACASPTPSSTWWRSAGSAASVRFPPVLWGAVARLIGAVEPALRDELGIDRSADRVSDLLFAAQEILQAEARQRLEPQLARIIPLFPAG